MAKAKPTYQSILADLKEGGMPFKEAQKEASKQLKALKAKAEKAEEKKGTGAKPESKEESKGKAKGGKVKKIDGAGETTKPQPKKPVIVGKQIEDEFVEKCREALDSAIEACEEAADESAKIVGKGGRFAMAARKLRQIRKFHIK